MNLIKLEEIKVRISPSAPLLGTLTADPEVYKRFIADKVSASQQEEELQALQVKEEEKKGWTRFGKDDHGLFLWSYMVKGFLKHAGEVLQPVKATRSKIDDVVDVKPRKLYLQRDKKIP